VLRAPGLLMAARRRAVALCRPAVGLRGTLVAGVGVEAGATVTEHAATHTEGGAQQRAQRRRVRGTNSGQAAREAGALCTRDL
jgi:hypothetical protein